MCLSSTAASGTTKWKLAVRAQKSSTAASGTTKWKLAVRAQKWVRSIRFRHTLYLALYT